MPAAFAGLRDLNTSANPKVAQVVASASTTEQMRRKGNNTLRYARDWCDAEFRVGLCRLRVKLRSHGSKVARPVYLYLMSVATAVECQKATYAPQQTAPRRSPRRRIASSFDGTSDQVPWRT